MLRKIQTSIDKVSIPTVKITKKDVPQMEGCYYAIQTALSTLFDSISLGLVNDFTVLQIKRLKALIKHSGIFDKDDKNLLFTYGTYGKITILEHMYKRLDETSKMLVELQSKWETRQAINLKEIAEILRRLSEFNNTLNIHYMYAKTRVYIIGPWENERKVYEKEGIH